ncbi:UNVERIFIED_ORG: hypothetical protein EDC92_11736 [Dietzia maris]|uniref:hypothetical protein n=1 Tax=Dietzia maris TaxID=37915 RepID=UPI00104A17B8
MTSSTDVDSAMADVLGSLPSASEDAGPAPAQGPAPAPARNDHGTLAAHDDGPCSIEEAEELVDRAIKAAETFYDTIHEIIRRQAWVPLGYPNPAELMLRKLGSTTVNPKTGKPYSRAHVHRMARVAWMLWAISSRTGVDPGDLSIPEKTLRDLPGGTKDDPALVDLIERRVADAALDGNASPDNVQEVIDATVAEAIGGYDEEDFVDDRGGPLQSIQSDGPSEGGGEGRRERGSSSRSDDFDEDDYEDDDGAPGDAVGPARPAYDAFTDGGDDFDEDDAPTTDAASALSQMRSSANFIKTLEDIGEIGKSLPEVSKVKAKLPQFLDIIDDDELDEFKSKLVNCRTILDRVVQAVDAIDATVEEVDLRLEDV